MNASALDPVIHPANRLQICAFLASVDSLEFSVVKETLGVSDSVLSKQIKALQEAGYVSVQKSPKNQRTHTWISLTEEGRAALTNHLAELRRIAALADGNEVVTEGQSVAGGADGEQGGRL